MLVGIYDAKFGKYGNERVQIYQKVLEHNNIQYVDLNINQPDFWEKVKKCNFFIFRWAHIDTHRQIANDILPLLEKEFNIKCFPDQSTCWHFDDKVRQALLMQAYNFPIIESYIFYDKFSAISWINSYTNFPLVFKLRKGAGSDNVILVRNRHTANYLIKKMFGRGIKSGHIPSFKNLKFYDVKTFLKKTVGILYYKYINNEEGNWNREKNYVFFQKFLPNNSYDTRITVIANKAFGFRRFNRKKDFRSSGSGIIDYNTKEINLDCVKIALEISSKMNFQTMAFDFLRDIDGSYKFCEINYTYDDRAIYKCDGYWDSNFNWHEGHFLPHFLHLQGLLNIPSLKQPTNIY